jgi:alpha-2-macroglobulin
MQMRALAFGLIFAALQPAVYADGDLIQFIENPNGVSPTRTLEFRFGEEMATPEGVVKGGLPSPIVIVPEIPGKWTWQSTRSGIFVPSQPWPLGTTVQIRAREEVTTLSGKTLPEDWKRTLDMPSFAIQAWTNLSDHGENDQTSEPRFCILFNANVSASSAAPSFEFVSGKQSIPAKVEASNPKHPGMSWFRRWESNDRSLLPWVDRFSSSGQNAPFPKNQLFITPAKPLPPGDYWKLRVAAGIPAGEGVLRTIRPLDIPVGTIKPFELKNIEATNYLNDGRKLRFTFNKALPPKLNTSALSRWISITPLPAKLEASVNGSVIEYKGEFEIGSPYRVAVEPGLPSAQPFVLSSGKIEELTFEQIPARVYFEAFETHQMSGGSRKFNLLAVNVPKLQVTAKLFTGTTIPVALRGYDEYYHAPRNAEDESHSRIDVEGLPGQVIWSKEILGAEETDEQRTIAFDWSEILGSGRSGVVLLTAEASAAVGDDDKKPGAQAIVQVTDLGAVWKRAPGETFVQVFSMKTGRGVANADVKLLTPKDEVMATAKADEYGIARLPETIGAKWILVENGTDSHLIEFRNGRNYINLARVDVEYSEDDERSAAEGVQAFLFTERGVYRPADTVHLKGIVRDRRPDQKPLRARLSVYDSREREFLTKKIALSALGSFSEDIALPNGVTGYYRAVLKLGEGDGENSMASHEFQVEEYKPNAFEILIGDLPKSTGPVEMSLPVSAKYYMGKALSKAQLTWSIDANDSGFSPDGFSGFRFTDAISDYRLEEHLGRRSYFSTQGKTELDPQGSATIASSVPLNVKAPQPRSIRVLTEITDVNQQTVSNSHTFTRHSSDYYLGFREFRTLLHEGESVPLEVVAIRTDGTPTPEPVKVDVQLTRIDWQTNRVETEDSATEYRNEAKLELAARRTLTTAAVTKNGDRWQVGETTISEPVIIDRPGHYLLELTAMDSAGQQVVTTTSFQAYGAGVTAWDYRNPFQVELIAEKDSYKAGETAKVLVKTPIEGDALVTVEREHVLRSFVTHLSGNSPVIEVPMLPADAPNVFVSVTLLRGADESPRKYKAPEYRIGYCELKVANPASKLSVYLKPGSKEYQPAEQVSVAAEVLDYNGKPVKDAEITLYAVDEGVLSLTGYTLPDPLIFFNQPRRLQVSTALTLPALLSEDPEERDFGNKGYLIGGGGDDALKLRKNFVACAFWNSTLRTDAAGKVLAEFTAPDSLTRYRVMAVVQTSEDQFGSADAAFEVNKPVMIEPALPRFANVGDVIALRAVIHNTTDLAGDADIRVDFDNTLKTPHHSQVIPLAAKQTTAIDIPVEFASTGTATWKWTVKFKSGDVTHQDAMQTTLKVGYPAPLLRHVKTMRVDGNVMNLLADVDPQLLEGKGTVRVSLTNSRAIELQEALDQLLHYPYGCVEQTTSSTLPWLTLTKFRDQVPSLQRTELEIKSSINRGIARLFSMQTDSGGLAYWPGASEPMLWGSAYGSLAITLAKQQGYAVPEEDYERLMKWMSQELRGTAELKSRYDLSPRALAMFALAFAGRAEPAYHELLFQKRSDLLPEDRALLALAVLESKGPSEMVSELLTLSSVQKPGEEWFWSPARNIALQMLCWTRFDATSSRVESLATELFNERRGGHWWTTQGNAWSLLAMGDYLTRVERNNKSANGRVSWGSQTATFALGSKAESKVQSFPVEREVSAEPMRLDGLNAGRLYTEVCVESYPPLREQPAQDRGYLLKRRYAKVEDDGTLSEAKDLRVGDRVLVTLDLECRKDASYLAIEDPLPAILEAVNPNFKSQETRAGEQLGSEWSGSFHELREDRALFFADHISQGTYTIRYLARVAAAGEATAPSAKVEEMYKPERFGLSETFKISAAALQ